LHGVCDLRGFPENLDTPRTDLRRQVSAIQPIVALRLWIIEYQPEACVDAYPGADGPSAIFGDPDPFLCSFMRTGESRCRVIIDRALNNPPPPSFQ